MEIKTNYALTGAKSIIYDNHKWFDFYLIAPKVITIILAALYFLAGIIFSIVLKTALCLVYFWIFGGIDCFITYVVLKIALSHRILHIYYLNLISIQNDTIKKQLEEIDKNTYKEITNNAKIKEILQKENIDQQTSEQQFKKQITCTIPNGTIIIKESAFYQRSDLTNIIIPDSVTTIENLAFFGCNRLTNVIIGKNVKQIGEWGFYGCSSLTNITFNGSVAEWNNINLEYYWNYNVPATKVHCTDGDAAI